MERAREAADNMDVFIGDGAEFINEKLAAGLKRRARAARCADPPGRGRAPLRRRRPEP